MYCILHLYFRTAISYVKHYIASFTPNAGQLPRNKNHGCLRIQEVEVRMANGSPWSSPASVTNADNAAYKCDNADIYVTALHQLRQKIDDNTITQTEFDSFYAPSASCSRKSAIDALAEARVAYNEKKSSTSRKFLAFLNGIFEPLDHFRAALDVLCQPASAPGLLIWGSIGIVVKVSITALRHQHIR